MVLKLNLHCKFPAILLTWMMGEGAGNCFGYQFGFSRGNSQVIMFMPCNWTPPSWFFSPGCWNTMAATAYVSNVHTETHPKILLKPFPFLSLPFVSFPFLSFPFFFFPLLYFSLVSSSFLSFIFISFPFLSSPIQKNQMHYVKFL